MRLPDMFRPHDVLCDVIPSIKWFFWEPLRFVALLRGGSMWIVRLSVTS